MTTTSNYRRRGLRRRKVAAVSTAMATLLLAACGSGGGTSGAASNGGAATGGGSGSQSFKGQTLTVELLPITIDAKGYNAYHNAMAKAFSKATGARVKYVTTSESSTEQFAQIEATHSGPDVLLKAEDGQAFASGAFVHLTAADWKVLGGTKQLYPVQLEACGPKGGPYDEVPMYNVPYVMVYNTKLFKKAGITSPPTTWTQYVKDAEKINNPSAGIYGTGFDPSDTQNSDNWKIAFYLSANYGGALYADHDLGNTPTIDSAPVQKAYEFWYDWYTKYHIVNPASLSWQEPQLQAAFAAGKIGMLPAVKSQYEPLYNSGAIGHDYAFATMPSVPYGMKSLPPGGTAPGSFLSQDGLYIGTYAPVKLALQFEKIMLEKKFQVMQYDLTGNMPVTTAAGSEVEKKAGSLLKPFFKALPSEEPEPFAVSWPVAQEDIQAMTGKLASTLATTHHLANADIGSALSKTEAEVKSGS